MFFGRVHVQPHGSAVDHRGEDFTAACNVGKFFTWDRGAAEFYSELFLCAAGGTSLSPKQDKKDGCWMHGAWNHFCICCGGFYKSLFDYPFLCETIWNVDG